MLPIWQAEFGLSYAAIGLLRGMFACTMVGFQIPGRPVERAARRAAGARGRHRSCRARLLPRAAGRKLFRALIATPLIAGLGASTQHPLASVLGARSSGPRSLGALGTYNFAGDLGKMALPAAASLLLVLLP